MTAAIRVQTGIALHDDGWRVIQRFTNPDGSVDHKVYDPPFATEREAEAKTKEAAQLWRQAVSETPGAVVADHP